MNPAPSDNTPLTTPRDAAKAVAARLATAGYRALFAGGCVRDALLGLTPADYDIATDASPEQVRAVFPRAVGVGESFGVMLVRHAGTTIEVATFRADGPYSDGRRPTEVRFTTDREDALRRDFTINGLFEDPVTGAIIDHVGGQADLRARCLRAIGDARERFAEDRLRTLRAVRFAARFDLSIVPATREAIRAFAHDLGAVSRERIGHEVRRMLAHPTRARAVELCEELGLAPVMLQEPGRVSAGAATEILEALPAEAAVATALAAWMLGRAGIATGAADISGTVAGADMCAPGIDAGRQRVQHWRRALLLSNDETDALRETLDLRQRILARWGAADTAERKRMAAREAFMGALQLVAAVEPARAAQIKVQVAVLAETGLAPAPFVTGDDLIRAGLTPGPKFRAILEQMYDRQLNGEVTCREQALRMVADLVERPFEA